VGYADMYWGIVDEMTRLIEAYAPLAPLQEIIFGEKEQIGQIKFPCLFMAPGDDDIDDITANADEHKIKFSLVLILQGRNLQQGLKDVISLGGNLYDLFKANRGLNGKCNDLHISKISPGYGRAENKTILHWASVEITVTYESL